MSEWLEARVANIREHMTSDDEASLWTLFFDDPEGEPVMASVIDGAMDDIDLRLVRRLAEVTAKAGAAATLIAVTRGDGQPRPEDRDLWRDLRAQLHAHPTRLLGFVVVGPTTHWVATGDGHVGTAA